GECPANWRYPVRVFVVFMTRPAQSKRDSSAGRSGIDPRRPVEDVPRPEHENLRAISEMEDAGLEERSAAERFSELISNVASTPTFALGHVLFFAFWIATQTGALPGLPIFDPFPFTFLTFVVSLEAIFLSIFVLISQGRMTRQAEKRSHLDLQVNLLAEQESTNALRLLRSIATHLGVTDVPPEDALEAQTSIRGLISDLDKVTD
ncbi:MAG TPA: DUF1003 domain-containing protein, partial [Rubrobacter sp.]|nr:DUF1003 domain-containing protein [Rubrobacter sp.]